MEFNYSFILIVNTIILITIILEYFMKMVSHYNLVFIFFINRVHYNEESDQHNKILIWSEIEKKK